MFFPQHVLEFADHLYSKEDYSAALQEYRRYQFLTQTPTEEITERTIDCLVKLSKFDEAIIESAKFQDGNKKSYTKGWIYFLAGDYDSSRIHLEHIGIPYKINAKKIIGLGYAYEFRFEEAGDYIELPTKEPTYKKPLLGAILALFPGGGHFYCGRNGDGIFSFLVVTSAALLAYHYYHQEEDIKFGVSLSAAIFLYAGNIYGSVNAVHNYNYYQNKEYLQEIIERSGSKIE
jgi:TM2 domain-containing membrane protein YozV